MPTTGSPKRACDQCHTVKEKCRRENPSVPCERCVRLRQSCQTIRSTEKTGRKRRGAQKLSYTLPTSRSPTNSSSGSDSDARSVAAIPQLYNDGLGSNEAILSDLDHWEKHFFNFMKDIIAPSPLDKFLVGPSFHNSHHTSFVQNLIQPTPELKNASVACAAVLFGDLFAEHQVTSTDVGHRRAALAVSSLRSFRISNEEDLTKMLVLGVAMITFAMHVKDGQPHLIARYTLSLIKTQYRSLLNPKSPMMDLFMCLISTDTFECLLRSEVPAWRIETSGRGNTVDRYLGLSYPLFPLFFDICEAANRLRHCDGHQRPEIISKLAGVSTVVEQWHPSTPEDFLERFNQAEVITILAQARILRLTGLLITHRLKFPFGDNDSEAQMLSQAIIFEFDTALQLTNRSVPCTGLAYLVACAEILDGHERENALLKSSNIVTFSKQAQVKLAESLSLIWKARDQGGQFHWFELGGYL